MLAQSIKSHIRPVSLKSVFNFGFKTVLVMFVAASLVIIAHQSSIISHLSDEAVTAQSKIEKLQPFVQLSEDQAVHMGELVSQNIMLTEQIETLEISIMGLEELLTGLEDEIFSLESNLNQIEEIKAKTGN